MKYGAYVEVEGREERFRLLDIAAHNLIQATDLGAFAGQSFRIQVDTLSGPRVGALYVHTTVADASKLFSVLSKVDCSAVRQIFPWNFENVACYWEGKRIRLEANWPPLLAVTDVRLSDIHPHPRGEPNLFFPGINEYGDVIALTVDDSCPHFLLGGTTGVGKSVAMQNIVLQFASHFPKTRLVLVDGKKGDGLGPVAHIQGQVGPIALSPDEITASISCVLKEMTDRYNRQPANFRDRKSYRKSLIPWYVFLDEVQEIALGSPHVAECLRKLAAQSRAVSIHLIMSTQKPLMEVFGNNTTKSNVPGRLALRTVNFTDSKLVVGGKFPRADYLQPWEAWCITPTEKYRRAQLFNVTEKELSSATAGRPEMDSWPMVDMADAMGQLAGPIKVNITPKQAVISIFGAKCGMGRDKLQTAWETAGEPEKSSTKAGYKRDWGREALRVMRECGYDFVKKLEG